MNSDSANKQGILFSIMRKKKKGFRSTELMTFKNRCMRS